MMDKSSVRGYLAALGPGLLWAGAAIGVSHIVQSTRAGAVYGWAMLWVVILANVMKFPAFETGPRYAAATGESLITGYMKLGRWVVWTYIILTFATMFTIQAGVTSVAAVMLNATLGSAAPSVPVTSMIIMAICAFILWLGSYSSLDKAMKFIIILLTISTVAAFFATLGIRREYVEGFVAPSQWTPTALIFMVALMGWMPSAIDISVWHSVWTLERGRATGHKPTLKESLFDFHLGYWLTAVTAILFLALGANITYGSGEEVKDGAAFGVQFINRYTSTLGDWSYWIIATAAITTMFSTALTCFDAFPRVLSRSWSKITSHPVDGEGEHRSYWIFMALLYVVSGIILFRFMTSLKSLVDFATTMSFLTAPILATFNHWLINSKHTPPEARPAPWLKGLSCLGIVFLLGFSVFYIVVRFFPQMTGQG